MCWYCVVIVAVVSWSCFVIETHHRCCHSAGHIRVFHYSITRYCVAAGCCNSSSDCCWYCGRCCMYCTVVDSGVVVVVVVDTTDHVVILWVRYGTVCWLIRRSLFVISTIGAERHRRRFESVATNDWRRSRCNVSLHNIHIEVWSMKQ